MTRFKHWPDSSNRVSLSVLLTTLLNRALMGPSAIDQNADIGSNAIGQIAHRDSFIGAVKSSEIGLRDGERIEAVRIIRDLAIVLAIRPGNHEAGHGNNVSVYFT